MLRCVCCRGFQEWKAFPLVHVRRFASICGSALFWAKRRGRRIFRERKDALLGLWGGPPQTGTLCRSVPSVRAMPAPAEPSSQSLPPGASLDPSSPCSFPTASERFPVWVSSSWPATADVQYAARSFCENTANILSCSF